MCILPIQKNVDDWPWKFSTLKLKYQLSLSNQNNAIIFPKIDNIPNPHPIKITTPLYKSLLLLAFLFIYYPFIVYLLFICYLSVISLLFLCLVPQIPPNSPQYPEKLLFRIIHCCISFLYTPFLIHWIFFIHFIQ